MALIKNAFFAGCTAGLLSACSGTLIQAERAAPATDPFAAALQAGYATLAREELVESDFGDVETFAARALAAASGKPPTPENFDTQDSGGEAAGTCRGARQPSRRPQQRSADIRARCGGKCAARVRLLDAGTGGKLSARRHRGLP